MGVAWVWHMVCHFPPFADTLHDYTTTTVNEICVMIIQWERKNGVTHGATGDILALMADKIFPELNQSPSTRKQVMPIYGMSTSACKHMYSHVSAWFLV
jgi:hypothetical protein